MGSEMLATVSLHTAGFFVVFGWSAGLSVQLSRDLDPCSDVAVGDTPMGGLMLVSEGELLC